VKGRFYTGDLSTQAELYDVPISNDALAVTASYRLAMTCFSVVAGGFLAQHTEMVMKTEKHPIYTARRLERNETT
jgi:hypothetical protein